jgi:hypothetical protein
MLSAIPSMSPIIEEDAPIEMRYSGMSGYTISLLMSVRRLAMPRMITLNTVNPILL